MKHQILIIGSIIVAGIVIAAIATGFVTGNTSTQPYITIDKTSDKNIGDKFTITGSTNELVGTDLLVEISPASFEPGHGAVIDQKNGTVTGEFAGATGTAIVTEGTGNSNHWSFDVDGANLKPNTYQVKTSTLKGDVFSTNTLTIH